VNCPEEVVRSVHCSWALKDVSKCQAVSRSLRWHNRQFGEQLSHKRLQLPLPSIRTSCTDYRVSSWAVEQVSLYMKASDQPLNHRRLFNGVIANSPKPTAKDSPLSEASFLQGCPESLREALLDDIDRRREDC
jgi:hypothetical protein